MSIGGLIESQDHVSCVSPPGPSTGSLSHYLTSALPEYSSGSLGAAACSGASVNRSHQRGPGCGCAGVAAPPTDKPLSEDTASPRATYTATTAAWDCEGWWRRGRLKTGHTAHPHPACHATGPSSGRGGTVTCARVRTEGSLCCVACSSCALRPSRKSPRASPGCTVLTRHCVCTGDVAPHTGSVAARPTPLTASGDAAAAWWVGSGAAGGLSGDSERERGGDGEAAREGEEDAGGEREGERGRYAGSGRAKGSSGSDREARSASSAESILLGMECTEGTLWTVALGASSVGAEEAATAAAL